MPIMGFKIMEIRRLNDHLAVDATTVLEGNLAVANRINGGI